MLGLVCSGPVLGADTSGQLQTAPVERSELQETLVLDGVIEAVQQSTVSAQTSGTVQQLPFDVDDSVAAGDLIVQLDSSEQRARLNQAQAGRDEARATLDDAQQQFDRIESIIQGSPGDRKSTRLNSSHVRISYAVFCLKKK